MTNPTQSPAATSSPGPVVAGSICALTCDHPSCGGVCRREPGHVGDHSCEGGAA